MKRLLNAACALFICASAHASGFNTLFADSTLRLDLILSGTHESVSVSLSRIHCKPGWAGRKTNLDSLLLKGSGDVAVVAAEGGTIYRNSFSTLFSEWLDLNPKENRAFQHSVTVPMPRSTATATVTLRDKRHNAIATSTFNIDPADILIKKDSRGALPHTYIHRGSFPGPKISVAILAEGYTEPDMPLFIADAKAAVKALFSHKPFDEFRERFDIIAVETPSDTTGVSTPKYADWRHTAFDSHFSTFYSDRYLTTPSVWAMHEACRGIPAEHFIILANSDEYGGGGIFNAYTLTSSRGTNFNNVVTHEFGHSFGGLADEYFYDGDVMDNTYPLDAEPWEPNITTLVDFDSKWKDMLADGTPQPTPTDLSMQYPVGLYEGGGYSFHGIYRPADYCRMRVNNTDAFCPVCQRAIRKMIQFYTE